MTLEISSTLLARLLNEAQSASDAEICGLLFGSETRIEAAQAVRNIAAEPARTFEIDPAALFAAHRAARAGGRQLIGHYHSHPSGDPVPSARDAEAAMGDGALWLILAQDEARLWQTLIPGKFQSTRLDVIAG